MLHHPFIFISVSPDIIILSVYTDIVKHYFYKIKSAYSKALLIISTNISAPES